MEKAFPIPFHTTWNAHDSSKITTYMTCRRKYFYLYLLGWAPDTPSLPLVHGEAWHRGMEKLLLDRSNIDGAIDAYTNYYRRFYGQDLDDDYAPRSPKGILESYVTWLAKYKDDTFRVLHTEVSGFVITSAKSSLNFRIDAIIEDKDGIWVLDHKTTGSTSNIYAEHFIVSFQMLAYIHAALMHFPDMPVQGLIVNRSTFLKTRTEHERIIIRKSPEMLGLWLAEAEDYLYDINQDIEKLSVTKDSDGVMIAFRRNTESCTKYFMMCPYFYFCSAWPNPLKRCHEVPVGFKQKWWDPSNRLED